MATYLPGVTDFIPDIQPFQPDWSTVDKTMRIKQGTYDQNYASLQGTYSGLLNMPQLKQDQIAKRDKFLKQAFKNLGDLSSVDLSLPENVASANNVFAPLYQDTDFLGNSAISKHYEQQESIADGFRLKDGGKEYSQDNVNYVRKQRTEYINDNSPEAWKRYYSNKRSYEPYYNVAEERAAAMEKFKPSSVAYTKMNGMYFVKTDDKSWREEEIKSYLNGVLSDKAKRQLQIEADVRLGNTNTIVNLYKSSAQKDLKFNNSKLQQIDTAIKQAKTPEEISQLQDLKIEYSKQNTELQSQVNRIESGDINFIKTNQESLAYKMYYNDFIEKTAKAYAHVDKKEDITENSVALGMWKDGQEWGRLKYTEAGRNARFTADLKYKYAALETRKAEEATAGSQPLVVSIPSGPGDKVETQNLSSIQTTVEQAKNTLASASENLKKHIAILDNVNPKNITSQRINEYLSSSKGRADTKVKQFNDVAKSVQLTIDDSENTLNQAKRYALEKMAADGIVGFDPFSGKTRPGTNNFMGKDLNKIFGGGNTIQERTRNAYFERDLANKNRAKFNKYQQEYFGTTQASINQGLVFADNDPRIKGTKQYLTAISGVDLNKIREVTLGVKDDNKLSFTIDDSNDKNKIDPDELKTKLSNKGFKVDYNADSKTFIINNSKINANLNPFNNLPSYAKQLIGTLNNRVGANDASYQSTFFQFDTKNSDGSKFRIDKHFGDSGSEYYLYREKNGKTIPLGTTFTTPLDAYKFAEDQAQNPNVADILFK